MANQVFRSRQEELGYRQLAACAWRAGRRPPAPEAYVQARVREEQLRTPVAQTARTPRETARTLAEKSKIVMEKLYAEEKEINPDLTPQQFEADVKARWRADLEAAGAGERATSLVPDLERISPGITEETLTHRLALELREHDVPAVVHKRIGDFMQRFASSRPMTMEEKRQLALAVKAASRDTDDDDATARVVQAAAKIDAGAVVDIMASGEKAAMDLDAMLARKIERDEEQRPYTDAEREQARLDALSLDQFEAELAASTSARLAAAAEAEHRDVLVALGEDPVVSSNVTQMQGEIDALDADQGDGHE